MTGTPMEVCVALGLLVSELNEEPWKGKVITFSKNPQLHILMTPKQRVDEKWETDYEVIQRKYKEKGFKNVPEIVFWNLRDSAATPVEGTQKGVAMVSGFSKNLLKLFLEEGGIVNSDDIMGLAIQGDEYNKLVVYD
ncbi:unnamed protein product [Cochlearia groenlandica]